MVGSSLEDIMASVHEGGITPVNRAIPQINFEGTKGSITLENGQKHEFDVITPNHKGQLDEREIETIKNELTKTFSNPENQGFVELLNIGHHFTLEISENLINLTLKTEELGLAKLQIPMKEDVAEAKVAFKQNHAKFHNARPLSLSPQMASTQESEETVTPRTPQSPLTSRGYAESRDSLISTGSPRRSFSSTRSDSEVSSPKESEFRSSSSSNVISEGLKTAPLVSETQSQIDRWDKEYQKVKSSIQEIMNTPKQEGITDASIKETRAIEELKGKLEGLISRSSQFKSDRGKKVASDPQLQKMLGDLNQASAIKEEEHRKATSQIERNITNLMDRMDQNLNSFTEVTNGLRELKNWLRISGEFRSESGKFQAEVLVSYINQTETELAKKVSEKAKNIHENIDNSTKIEDKKFFLDELKKCKDYFNNLNSPEVSKISAEVSKEVEEVSNQVEPLLVQDAEKNFEELESRLADLTKEASTGDRSSLREMQRVKSQLLELKAEVEKYKSKDALDSSSKLLEKIDGSIENIEKLEFKFARVECRAIKKQISELQNGVINNRHQDLVRIRALQIRMETLKEDCAGLTSKSEKGAREQFINQIETDNQSTKKFVANRTELLRNKPLTSEQSNIRKALLGEKGFFGTPKIPDLKDSKNRVVVAEVLSREIALGLASSGDTTTNRALNKENLKNAQKMIANLEEQDMLQNLLNSPDLKSTILAVRPYDPQKTRLSEDPLVAFTKSMSPERRAAFNTLREVAAYRSTISEKPAKEEARKKKIDEIEKKRSDEIAKGNIKRDEGMVHKIRKKLGLNERNFELEIKNVIDSVKELGLTKEFPEEEIRNLPGPRASQRLLDLLKAKMGVAVNAAKNDLQKKEALEVYLKQYDAEIRKQLLVNNKQFYLAIRLTHDMNMIKQYDANIEADVRDKVSNEREKLMKAYKIKIDLPPSQY